MFERSYTSLSLYLSRLVIYVLITLLALWLALPFAAPIILACIVSSIFLELGNKLPRVYTRHRGLYALVSIVLTLLLIIIPLGCVLILLGMEAFSFITFIQNLVSSEGYTVFQDKLSVVETEINKLIQPMGTELNFEDIGTSIIGYLETIGTAFYTNATHILGNIAGLLFQTFFFLFIMFFLVKDGEEIMPRIKRLLPFDKDDTQHFVDAVEHVGQTVIFGSIIASLILGVLMTVVFTLFGFASPLLWGMCIALMALIPLVGTWLIYIPSIVFLFITAGWVKALLFVIVVIILENILFYGVIRPKFLDSKTQLYPIAIFIAILGGLTNFGAIGIVYGPLIMAAFITIARHLSASRGRKYDVR